jgi:hypothetical protein
MTSRLIIIPNDYIKPGDLLTHHGKTVRVLRIDGAAVVARSLNVRGWLYVKFWDAVLEVQITWWASKIRRRMVKMRQVK